MSQIQANNPIYNYQTGTPLYNYAGTPVAPQPQQQTVTVSQPGTSSVYQYPQTSVYNDPNKQAASGVNIYIYNPSAIGGPTSNSTANANYSLPAANQTPIAAQTPAPAAPVQSSSTAIANTPISQEEKTEEPKNTKTKKIVELTDDYIKTLESYVKSNDATIRKTGIKELIQRYEEDDSRYEDPALTALLNVALQDPDANNRLLAMSPVASGSAHGDATTVELLKTLQTSDKIYGQEAVMANNSLLKAAETKISVPDNSPEKKE